MAYLTSGGGVGQSDLCMPHRGYSFGDIPMSSGYYCTPDWANVIGIILSWTLVLFAPFAVSLIAVSLSDWFKRRAADSDAKNRR